MTLFQFEQLTPVASYLRVKGVPKLYYKQGDVDDLIRGIKEVDELIGFNSLWNTTHGNKYNIACFSITDEGIVGYLSTDPLIPLPKPVKNYLIKQRLL